MCQEDSLLAPALHGSRDVFHPPVLVGFMGSNFIKDGTRYAGAAVTNEDEAIWAEALPPGTSAQRAELIALTKELHLGKDKRCTIYSDSQYLFTTVYIHDAIYRERGLLTAEGKAIKNKQEILDLLWDCPEK